MGKVTEDGGIPCPTCGKRSRVIETRQIAVGLRRRRRCQSAACGGRFNTVELVAPAGRMADQQFAIVAIDQLDRMATLALSMLPGGRS